MTNSDPLVSNYEFSLVAVPTIAAILAAINAPTTAILWLFASAVHEMYIAHHKKRLVWGENWGKWENVIQHLYVNSSRGFPTSYQKILAMWTALNIVLNFYVLYRIQLSGIFFALWCYSFLVPAMVWMVLYNSGFPSSANYVEYRKDLIRPVQLTIYAIVIVNCIRFEQLPVVALAIASTFGIDYLRRQVHYNNEFQAVLQHLECSNPIPSELNFRRIVGCSKNNFPVITRDNRKLEYESIGNPPRTDELIAVAIFCATCRTKIRLRHIGFSDAKELNEYNVHYVKIAQLVDPNRLPTCDDIDLAYIFMLQPMGTVSKRLVAQFSGWQESEFKELSDRVNTMEHFTSEQKQKIQKNIALFLSSRTTSIDS